IVLNLQTEANVRCRELDALRTLLAPHREPTGIARIVSALRRSFTRRIYGIGRPLADGGRAYAICGADGSGKSAAAKRVVSTLSRQIRVRHVYLGGSPHSRGLPRHLYRLTVFPVYSVVWRLWERLFGAGTAKPLKDLFYGIEAILIGLEKWIRYRGVQRAL